MVPGQLAILLGAIVSAVVLLIMGVISFQNSKKERRAAARKQAREEARRKMEEADAAFEEELQENFATETEGNLPLWEEPEFVLPEPADEPEHLPERSTRNDFDFKF